MAKKKPVYPVPTKPSPMMPARPAAPIATARAGNYVAPVDTSGMDPEMMKTLQVATPRAKKPVRQKQ